MAREAYIKEKSRIQKMRDGFLLEKDTIDIERETFNRELRVQCMKRKVFGAENDAMADARENRKRCQ